MKVDNKKVGNGSRRKDGCWLYRGPQFFVCSVSKAVATWIIVVVTSNFTLAHFM